ncbi:hypothetical protein Ddye_010004 [Dipteronia dyeriana]|uniref:Uncharacterized protein n=1 Tax=Dipteronia dyeriana TaxID=168575 RepID=A0AAE0CMT8_9ROSI|nr:hypothetical protein Ddye_010004 [Dipteronia dyeriana]
MAINQITANEHIPIVVKGSNTKRVDHMVYEGLVEELGWIFVAEVEAVNYTRGI